MTPKGKEEISKTTGKSAKKWHRFLLSYPGSFHLAKVITRGLKAERRIIISLALGDIDDFATENVDLCQKFEPRDSFAREKNSYQDEKLIGISPMAKALDDFRDAFFQRYPIDAAIIAEQYDNMCQEKIEQVEEQLSLNKRKVKDGLEALADDLANLDLARNDFSKAPDSELLFYDTECKPKRHDALKVSHIQKTARDNNTLSDGKRKTWKYDVTRG
ncbi:hypothetical protein GGS23DRAFT_612583 [Durotheca rogersii]|uniref:uncharacterized protein n=1 Tax=Durotheca rogersii TaxID=419775 RepID=UPI00221EBA49|nr:uncharacterized protein GGS23DRAFT_612583 [Durotheca rogersii]KAI5867458.1 hypothetical protein GGS23DRAFT_612583 [Durotheca rogersii]